MKKLVAVFVLLLSFLAFADSDRILSDEERKILLGTIDSICGDTWCEGDFDYSFNHIECSKSTGTCIFKLEFIYREWGDDDMEEVILEARIPVTCNLDGFYKKSDLVASNEQGENWHTEKLYDAVNLCIENNTEDAISKSTIELVQIYLKDCSSADVYWTEFNYKDFPKKWDMNEVLKRLDKLSEKVSPEGKLTKTYLDDFDSSLLGTPLCKAKKEVLFHSSTHKAAMVTVTNEAGKTGSVTLVRWAPYYEAYIYQTYAN